MNIAYIKKILPKSLKVAMRKITKLIKYRYRRFAICSPVSRGEQIKIIVGAAETYQDDWYSTNEQWLDIADSADWQKVFHNKKIITHVVAEHVFEHLTLDECRKALSNINKFMTDGGIIRIAVPDGYHPNEEYLRHVGIGGIGDDAADHKQLLNIDILSELLRETGFEPVHLEGYDNMGKLIQRKFSIEDGYIYRSRLNASPETIRRWAFVDADTSLIVDGIKK